MTDARETALTEFTRDSMSIRYPTFISRDDAQTVFDKAVAALASAGFRILGPDEIDGQIVEKCVEVADGRKDMRERLYAENQASINAYKAVEAEEIAAAIRALKEKRT